jgi:hypothetical protein
MKFIKGIFLGFPMGVVLVLLALLIAAFTSGTTNPALTYLSDPLYMFATGEFLGVGIEVVPELEKA